MTQTLLENLTQALTDSASSGLVDDLQALMQWSTSDDSSAVQSSGAVTPCCFESVRIDSLALEQLMPDVPASLLIPTTVDLLRLDLIHPVLQGNKLFKLLPVLEHWLATDRRRWLTPGGVWSNHLHAVAWLAHQLGVPATGLVRGYADLPLKAMLEDCQRWGMELVFLDKRTYRQRHSADWQQQVADQHQAFFIGEGGAAASFPQPVIQPPDHRLSKAVMTWLAGLCAGYDQVCLATGTGTLATHIMGYLPDSVAMVAIQVAPDQGGLERQWQQAGYSRRWKVLTAADPFGKGDARRMQFIQQWDAQGIPLDPVYGAPLMATVAEHSEAFVGRRTLVLHGGGLQGRRGVGLDWFGQ